MADTTNDVGTALAVILACVVVGMSAWIFRTYLRRLASRPDSERRSGLLPLHVLGVSSWSIAVVFRMIARDLYRGEEVPLWLDWPATIVLVCWLIAALLLVVVRYRQSSPPKLREI